MTKASDISSFVFWLIITLQLFYQKLSLHWWNTPMEEKSYSQIWEVTVLLSLPWENPLDQWAKFTQPHTDRNSHTPYVWTTPSIFRSILYKAQHLHQILSTSLTEFSLITVFNIGGGRDFYRKIKFLPSVILMLKTFR